VIYSKRNRFFVLLSITFGLLFCLAESAQARKIPTIRGKKYKITKQHGPWMILVANFRPRPEEFRSKGMTPEQAADELVYELRKQGVPAYTYVKEIEQANFETTDRTGRPRLRQLSPQFQGITVLAGNYPTTDNKLAQKTLRDVKKYHPRFLRSIEKSSLKKNGKSLRKVKSGGIFRITPGRPGPLSGAMLTINPLLSPEEVRTKERNPLLLALNSRMDHSLLQNPGDLTLVVATFRGKSQTYVPGRRSTNRKKLQIGETLDDAAMRAWELTKVLREFEGVEAYVFHDRHQSIVTVGSFRSRNDPRIATMAEKFRAKKKIIEGTQREATVAEFITLPRKPRPGQKIEKSWIFDPNPTVMAVPRI